MLYDAYDWGAIEPKIFDYLLPPKFNLESDQLSVLAEDVCLLIECDEIKGKPNPVLINRSELASTAFVEMLELLAPYIKHEGNTIIPGSFLYR